MDEEKEVEWVEVPNHNLIWGVLSTILFFGGFMIYPNYRYPKYFHTVFMDSLFYYYLFYVGYECVTGYMFLQNVILPIAGSWFRYIRGLR
jgi:hypothetical protein